MRTPLTRGLQTTTLAAIIVSYLTLPLTPAMAHRSVDRGFASGPLKRAPGLFSSDVSAGVPGDHQARQVQGLDKLPGRFEPNRGQADPRVDFVSHAGGGMLQLTSTGATWRVAPEPATQSLPSKAGDDSRSIALQMRLLGAKASARGVGVDELPGKSNYLIGNDPARWSMGVSSYSKVRYRGVYRGTDVSYYFSDREFEYDFNVAPGASYKAISLRFDGASRVSIDRTGELVIGTEYGDIRQRTPVAYQETGSVRRFVACRYEAKGKGEIGFHVSGYDPTRPLVIDPVLVYSTLIGGSDTDAGAAVAVNAAGEVYTTGKTVSATRPESSNAFITKLNSSGTGIIYSTFIGGSNEDFSHAIAVDSAGNAYVTGYTRSADFPTTPGAFQRQAYGQNAFVVKLNSDGSLAYSTYLGDADEGNGIAADSFGNAYVTGSTSSRGFPTTPGAYQTVFGGGSDGGGDAFVTKLNPSGTSLVYSTYLGGNRFEAAYGIAIDAAGNAYVTGSTGYEDTTFPRTRRAFQTAFGGGALDAFVTKLNSTGTALVYSTLLGGGNDAKGDGNDVGHGIAVDAAGNAYVTGATGSANFPTTAGAYQTNFGGGTYFGDVFVTKLDPKGSDLIYSTYLGGIEEETGYGIAIDALGNAYVTGVTSSSDFPLSAPLQRKNESGPAFKSTDGGVTWRAINNGLSGAQIVALAVDPRSSSTVYAVLQTGLFKSLNGGIAWMSTSDGLDDSPFTSLVIDPQNSSTLFLGSGKNLYKSTNAGADWKPTSLAISAGPSLAIGVAALAIDPTQPSTIYAGTSKGMFKSTDSGDTWNAINAGAFIPQYPVDVTKTIAVDPANPSTLYFSSSTVGTFKSVNGGASWSHIYYRSLNINTTALAVGVGSILYAGAGEGVIKSTDGGENWTALTSGLPGNVSLLAIDPAAPSTIYSTFRSYPIFGGLFKSSDTGNRWSAAGLNNIYIYALAIDPHNPLTMYAGANAESFTQDSFVAKLNAGASALVYSTYLGGHSDDTGLGIAVDPAGNAYVAGTTGSANFQTTDGVFQRPYNGGNSDAFVAKIASPFGITNTLIKGKKLFVMGDAFSAGAVILLNGEPERTQNDETSPTTLLIAKKGAKRLSTEFFTTLQVRNADGTLSNTMLIGHPIP